MTTYKGSYFFLNSVALCVVSFPLHAINYSLSSRVIRPGERTTIEFRVPIPKTLDIDSDESPIVEDDLLTQSPKIVLLEKIVQQTSNEWIWKYHITAYEPGTFTVPPVQIWTNGQNYSTERELFEVLSYRSLEDNDLRPEYGEEPLPFPWLKSILALLGALCFSCVVYFSARRKKQVKPGPVSIAPPPPDPYDWIRARLSEFRSQLEKGDFDASIVDEITLALKEFFARLSGKPVTGWTTRELSIRMDNFSMLVPFIQIFDNCDKFKFSGIHTLPADAVAWNTLRESEQALGF